MDKLRLHQILNALLLPYKENTFSFINEDIIANNRYYLSKLKFRDCLSKAEQSRYEKEYDRSERKIEEFLLKHQEYHFTDIDDFKMLLSYFYPENVHYKDEKSIKLGDIEFIYFSNIFKIADSLLTLRDGRIAIKTWTSIDHNKQDIFAYTHPFNKVETWNLLCRMISHDIIVIAFYIVAGLHDTKYLYGNTGNILLADKTVDSVLQKGLSETHFHLTSGIEFTFLWQKIIDFPIWEEFLSEKGKYLDAVHKTGITFPAAMYHILWAEYLENEHVNCSFAKYIDLLYTDIKADLYKIINIFYNGNEVVYKDEWKLIYHKFCTIYSLQTGIETPSFTNTYKKYKSLNTYEEMIFLYKSLLYLVQNKSSTDEYYRENLHLFLQYIRCKNFFYSKIVQSNYIQGISNFKKYFENMRRIENRFWNPKELADIIFKSVSHNMYLKKLEMRIPPYVKFCENTKYLGYETVKKDIYKNLLIEMLTIFESFQESIISYIGLDPESSQKKEIQKKLKMFQREKITIPTIGIVFHFLKRDFVDNKIADSCWVNSDFHTKGKHILSWREAMVNTAIAIEELRSEIPYLADYIVGIDAASEENRTEPWILAPVYANIRNRDITKPVIIIDKETHRINNIGFTYHVGEEFRHILSGLRHIDEVIDKFHYKAGDRLGHALALGVDINDWIDRNEVVVIPIIEYMEDLIWLWGNLVYKRWPIQLNAEILEGRILSYAKQIYGDIQGLTVPMLYEAYQLKFEKDYDSIFNKVRDTVNVDYRNVNPHFCKFYSKACDYGLNWTAEKVFCTYFCPVYYQKAQHPVFVTVEKEEYNDLKQIQDFLIEKIERIGIYVELNPTSNLAIGNVRSLLSEHILNLNSKGLEDGRQTNEKREVLITINTDDPVVFSTSNENEISYIYYALMHKGYKKESVLQWIDKIRQMGMDGSFIQVEKSPFQQWEEISKMIKLIKDKIKFLD